MRSPTSRWGWGAALSPDRKSTRLNSSHGYTSHAVFCLKKKKIRQRRRTDGSPRHFRALNLEDLYIPYIRHMKKAVTAVANIVNNRRIAEQDALAADGPL